MTDQSSKPNHAHTHSLKAADWATFTAEGAPESKAEQELLNPSASGHEQNLLEGSGPQATTNLTVKLLCLQNIKHWSVKLESKQEN